MQKIINTFSAKSRYPTTSLLKPDLNRIIFTASCSRILSLTSILASSFSLVDCSSLSLISFSCCCWSCERLDDVLWAFLFSFFNSLTSFDSLFSDVSKSAFALAIPCSPSYEHKYIWLIIPTFSIQVMIYDFLFLIIL